MAKFCYGSLLLGLGLGSGGLAPGVAAVGPCFALRCLLAGWLWWLVPLRSPRRPVPPPPGFLVLACLLACLLAGSGFHVNSSGANGHLLTKGGLVPVSLWWPALAVALAPSKLTAVGSLDYPSGMASIMDVSLCLESVRDKQTKHIRQRHNLLNKSSHNY